MRLRYLLLGLLASVLTVSACKDEGTTKPQTQEAQLPQVPVVELKAEDIPLSFEFSARTQGYKETQVRARVGGILIKRNYVEGSRVEEGSVLFEIDPAPYEVALKQAQAQLAQAKAQLSSAETQWNRTEKLFKEGYASEKTRDEARSNRDSLLASVQLAEAAVDSAKLNLDYTKVTAPISGITSLGAQSEGSLISTSGDSSLLTSITQIDPIYVIFSATEGEILSLTNMTERGLIKNPARGEDIFAKLKLGDGSIYNEDGKINFINPTIDEATGTIKLRAVFPNPEGKLRPGQFVRLIMEGLVRLNALVLPQEAVMQGANGSFVYRVNSQGVIEMVSVQTGLTTPNGEWIIDEGLNPGDKVIYEGLLKLRPGMKVSPVVSQAAAPNVSTQAQ